MADCRDVPERPAIPDRCIYFGTGKLIERKRMLPMATEVDDAREKAGFCYPPAWSQLLFLVLPYPCTMTAAPMGCSGRMSIAGTRHPSPGINQRSVSMHPVYGFGPQKDFRCGKAGAAGKTLPFNNGIFHMFLTCGPTGTSTSSTSH